MLSKKNIILAIIVIFFVLGVIYLVKKYYFNKITDEYKQIFINNLLTEWKNQTNDANIKRDARHKYEGDYYLSFSKKKDDYNHIHLILQKFNKNHNAYDNIKYIIKKNNNNKIIYSQVIDVSIFSDPKIIVENMIKHYENFTDN